MDFSHASFNFMRMDPTECGIYTLMYVDPCEGVCICRATYSAYGAIECNCECDYRPSLTSQFEKWGKPCKSCEHKYIAAYNKAAAAAASAVVTSAAPAASAVVTSAAPAAAAVVTSAAPAAAAAVVTSAAPAAAAATVTSAAPAAAAAATVPKFNINAAPFVP